MKDAEVVVCLLQHSASMHSVDQQAKVDQSKKKKMGGGCIREKGGAISLEPEEGEETPVTEPPHTGVLSRDRQLQLLATHHRSRSRHHLGRSPIWDWGLCLGLGTFADLGLGISSNRSTCHSNNLSE
jgi:hypothetical protein